MPIPLPTHPRYQFLIELPQRTPAETDELYILEQLATFPPAIAQHECAAASYRQPVIPDKLTPEQQTILSRKAKITAYQHMKWIQTIRFLQHSLQTIWEDLSKQNAAIRGPMP